MIRDESGIWDRGIPSRSLPAPHERDARAYIKLAYIKNNLDKVFM